MATGSMGNIRMQYSNGYKTQNRQTSSNTGIQQYAEDDAFLQRGARIAEKIQEFYNSTGQPISGNSSTVSAAKPSLNNQGGRLMTGSKLITDHAQGQNRPRAASAYGTQTSRRNITTVP